MMTTILRNVPTRLPRGGRTADLTRPFSSQTYGYYRRQAARRSRLDIETALAELRQSVDPADHQEADRLQTRYERLANANSLPSNILAGIYLPPRQATGEGIIPATDAQPQLIHREAKYPIIPGYDVTLNEDPVENQEVMVIPEIVAELQTYNAFKPRTVENFLASKNKATQIVRKYDMPQMWKHHQIVMATALAFEPTTAEMAAFKHISSSAVASKATWVNDRLSGGNKDLRECAVLKPKLVTRFLDWFHPRGDRQSGVPVK